MRTHSASTLTFPKCFPMLMGHFHTLSLSQWLLPILDVSTSPSPKLYKPWITPCKVDLTSCSWLLTIGSHGASEPLDPSAPIVSVNPVGRRFLGQGESHSPELLFMLTVWVRQDRHAVQLVQSLWAPRSERLVSCSDSICLVYTSLPLPRNS